MTPDERRQGYVRRWRHHYDSALYRDPVLWRVYDYLEAHVNWKAATLFDGTPVLPGQIVTSRDKLAGRTSLTVRQVRGAITRLAQAGFLTSKTTNQYTLLTLTNWAASQSDDDTEGPAKGPAERPASDQQTTSEGPASDHNIRKQSGNQGNRETPEIQTDHDCSPASQKPAKTGERNGRVRSEKTKPSEPTPHPRIQKALADYLNQPGDDERVEPSPRHVAEVVGVAMKHGRSEDQVISKLTFLHDVRGLRPGTSHGPRHYNWFATVLDDAFTQEDERLENANPTGFDDWELRNASKALRMDREKGPAF